MAMEEDTMEQQMEQAKTTDPSLLSSVVGERNHPNWGLTTKMFDYLYVF
jgi:hypothetical protein